MSRYEKYYTSIVQDYKISPDGEGHPIIIGRCPIHGDATSVSFAANLVTGKAACYGKCGFQGISPEEVEVRRTGCTLEEARKVVGVGAPGKRGRPTKEEEQKKVVPIDVIEARHASLIYNQAVLDELMALRGWTLETIKEYKIGYGEKENRIWIPVMEEGEYVDVRKYDWKKKTKYKFLPYEKGWGKKRLWPRRDKGTHVLLVEGEPDALLALGWGFDCRTFTAGAGAPGTLVAERCTILYDKDVAGKTGAQKALPVLKRTCREIKVLELPDWEGMPGNADLTDWWRQAEGSAEKLSALIDELWAEDAPVNSDPIPLKHAALPALVNTTVKVSAVVSGTDLQPYHVPKRFSVACAAGGNSMCGRCPLIDVVRETGRYDHDIPENSSLLIECAGIPKKQQRSVLKEHLGIPATCTSAEITPVEMFNLWSIRLTSQVDLGDTADEAQYTVLHAWSTKKIELNHPVIVTAKAIPDPKTQHATLLINKVELDKTSLESFALTPEDHKALEIFRPTEGIPAKLRHMYEDFACNVTRIYKRLNLHFIYDLIAHSALRFEFQGEMLERGWAEALVVGDTRSGKSRVIKKMMQHYQNGRYVDCGRVSFAGIIGGMQQVNNTWNIQWGVIPLNDQRMVALDEAGKLKVEQIGEMTGVRSSGIAEITKIQQERTTARCRLIWGANPRAIFNREIKSYAYGVQAVQELIGKAEDIARFDMVYGISSADVTEKVLNAENRPTTEHVYTSELCRLRLLRAWSRKPEQIRILPETEREILQAATAMSQKYSSEIPIVERSEQRIRIARLSVALANMLCSTDETGEITVVLPEHARTIQRFMESVYDDDVLRYDRFSKYRQQVAAFTPEEVAEGCALLRRRVENAAGSGDVGPILSYLSESESVDRNALANATGWDFEHVRDFIKFFTTKTKGLRVGPGQKLIKTPLMLAILKKLDSEEIQINVKEKQHDIWQDA